jgi:hypothetical protein
MSHDRALACHRPTDQRREVGGPCKKRRARDGDLVLLPVGIGSAGFDANVL